MTRVPVAEGLFDEAGGVPALIGGRCDDCGTITFPLAPGCPRCSSASVSSTALATRGTLWTWTSQEFQPVAPPYIGPGSDGTDFAPYFVGYVELPDELRIEARLTGFTDRTPRIGEEMELVIVPFTRNDDGDEVVSYAFAPVEEGASA